MIAPGAASACLNRERLLHNDAEATGREYVWVWEVDSPAVIMGHSADCVFEVRSDACDRDGIPILRRDSGGRTVLLGKGCLNYSLILRAGEAPVEDSYRTILGAVLSAASVDGAGPTSTDLTVQDRKFGGCAQRRRRRTLLHHGTILYNFDIAAIPHYLAEPVKQPPHRAGRSHVDFLTNVDVHPNFAQSLAAHFPQAEFVS